MSSFAAYITKGHHATRVEEFTPSEVTAEVLLKGEIAIFDDTNNWVERAGADPAAGTIVGLCEVVSENAKTLTRNGKIPIRKLYPGHVLAMSSATTYVEATHRGHEYGITRNSTTGFWQVDVAKTGADARVLVHEGDAELGIWEAEILAEFLAYDTIDS